MIVVSVSVSGDVDGAGGFIGNIKAINGRNIY